MSTWRIHPQLEADSILAIDGERFQLRILNEQRYQWFILIPKVIDAVEMSDLPTELQQALITAANEIGHYLLSKNDISKLNMGYLGNLVPQFHFHVLGRDVSDPAWPGPVWGHSPRQAMSDEHIASVLGKLKDLVITPL